LTYLLIGSEDPSVFDSPVHAHVLLQKSADSGEDRTWISETPTSLRFVAKANALGDQTLDIATLSFVATDDFTPYRPIGAVGKSLGSMSAVLSAMQVGADVEFRVDSHSENSRVLTQWPEITRIFVETAVMGRMDLDVIDREGERREST